MATEETKKLGKLVVLIGPTASGKTAWSLQLAEKYNGEIISADSRQIFKKMTIGTAKVVGEWKWAGLRRTYIVQNIVHHLVDFLDPGKVFSASEFRDKAVKYAQLANDNEKIPFLVGGTGLYIQSVVDNYDIPRVMPNKKLRESLEEQSFEELIALLERLDPETALTIDRKNKRRLIRALEVCIFSGEPFSEQRHKGEPLFDLLQIGIEVPRDELYARIDARVDAMVAAGLQKEIQALIRQKYSWALPSMNGVGYKEFKDKLDDPILFAEGVELLKRNTRLLAKKQLTWFRRDKRIQWVTTVGEAEQLVQDFLKK